MFSVIVGKQATKKCSKLPLEIQQQVREVVIELQKYPSTHHLRIKKLVGKISIYRLRIENYRILFEIDSKAQEILVTDIDDRKDVYR